MNMFLLVLANYLDIWRFKILLLVAVSWPLEVSQLGGSGPGLPMQVESTHQHCTLLKTEPEGRVCFQDGSLQGLSISCIRDLRCLKSSPCRPLHEAVKSITAQWLSHCFNGVLLTHVSPACKRKLQRVTNIRKGPLPETTLESSYQQRKGTKKEHRPASCF